MHTREDKKEPNVFAQGIAGWKMLFGAFKKKKPEQQQNNESTMANANS